MSRKIYKLILGMLFVSIIAQIPLYTYDKEQVATKTEEQNLKTSQDVNWWIIPSLNNKYFSPEDTPGVGDSVLYTFAIDQTKDINLNISAY